MKSIIRFKGVPTRLASAALLVGLVIGVSSCSKDSPTSFIGGPATPRLAQSNGQGRWAGVADAQFVQEAAAASYRVLIGFREPGAGRGVGSDGRSLVTRGRASLFKADLVHRGARFLHEYELVPAVYAELPDSQLLAIRHLPFVEYVEPVFPGVRASQDTTWNIRIVGAPTAWTLTKGSGVKVEIIDSGVDQTHQDISADVVHACDGSSGYDNVGHGTFVAGVIRAADNQLGIIGGAPQILLYSGKDGDANPNAAYTACEVEWGRNNGVFAINISTNYQYPYQTLTDQINAAYQEGRLIVVSAGNTNGGPVGYPATLDNVIAVGATTSTDQLASFSATGSKIELVAPGQGVASTALPYGIDCGNGSSLYSTCDGTSFAAPHVAFAAALVKAWSPSMSNSDVRARLQISALDLGAAGRDNQFGYGRLDAARAVGLVGSTIASLDFTGPWCLYADDYYTYTGSETGGIGPFTYTWYRQISPDTTWQTVGNGQQPSIYFPGGSYGSMLKMRVTPAEGPYREVIHFVYMVSGYNAPTADGGRDQNMCARH